MVLIVKNFIIEDSIFNQIVVYLLRGFWVSGANVPRNPTLLLQGLWPRIYTHTYKVSNNSQNCLCNSNSKVTPWSVIHLNIIAITYIAYIIVDSDISVAIAWVIIIILIINIKTYKVTKLLSNLLSESIVLP